MRVDVFTDQSFQQGSGWDGTAEDAYRWPADYDAIPVRAISGAE